MGKVSQAQLARLVGCSRAFITKKVQDGTLPFKDGLIDEEQAKAILQNDQDPSRGNPKTKKIQDHKLGDILKVKEYYKAKQERIKYLELVGRLVDADKVKQEAFEVARGVRDHMLNIPNRVAGQLAAESNQDRVFEILNKEILQALEGLPSE